MSQTRVPTNYDEARVPAYTLPDPLLLPGGVRVATAGQWRREQRRRILALYRDQVYGTAPARPAGMRFEVVEEARGVLGGIADRRQVVVHLGPRPGAPTIEVLAYTPSGASGPVPAFVGLNFMGNQTVCDDPAIRMTTRWVPDYPGTQDHRATEATRGHDAESWPVRAILACGCALVTVYCGDLEPDHAEGWRNGVRGLLRRKRAADFTGNDWGCIGAWAWGLSRTMDYLETWHATDPKRVAVIGHSRLGKTALWAGAQDERFSVVISNNSGEGGAAISRRCFGEQPADLVRAFPHWFCRNFSRYANNEAALPVDSHELIALMAPRVVYVASATEDKWADPHGEYLACVHAQPVYDLFNLPGVGSPDMPPPDRSVGDHIGYHIRTGKHDILPVDWGMYMDFALRHWRGAGRS